jgi:hypothetical protein
VLSLHKPPHLHGPCLPWLLHRNMKQMEQPTFLSPSTLSSFLTTTQSQKASPAGWIVVAGNGREGFGPSSSSGSILIFTRAVEAEITAYAERRARGGFWEEGRGRVGCFVRGFAVSKQGETQADGLENQGWQGARSGENRHGNEEFTAVVRLLLQPTAI